MSFELDSQLNLSGEPEIKLSRLAPKEARGLIMNQLRQIRTSLSQTIARGLAARDITNVEVENVGVYNSVLSAKIRGKIAR